MTLIKLEKNKLPSIRKYSLDNPILGALMSHGASGKEAKIYTVEPYMYRCVNLRAATLASMPYHIENGRGDTVYSSDEQVLPRELSFLGNFWNLLYTTEADFSIFNQGAFWFKLRNAMGVKKVKRLLPSTVGYQTSGRNEIVYFTRAVSDVNTPLTMPLDDVVYFKRYSSQSEIRSGASPAAAALSSSGVLYSVDEFAKDFFDRGAIKGSLLTVEGNPQPNEMARLESWWQSAFSGLRKSWQTAAIKAGVKVIPIGDGISELSNNDLTEEKREAITTAFGVPDSLVMSNASNFATAQQDARNFYIQTMIPEFLLVSGIVNEQLLEAEGYRIVLDAHKITELQEDEEERAASFVQIVNGLAVARNNGINPVPIFNALGMTVDTESQEEPLFLPLSLPAEQPPAEVVNVTPEEMPALPPPTDDTVDMRNWRRKATKALERGKSPAVKFNSNTIDARKQEAIAELLEKASTREEIDAAFAVPFRAYSYP